MFVLRRHQIGWISSPFFWSVASTSFVSRRGAYSSACVRGAPFDSLLDVVRAREVIDVLILMGGAPTEEVDADFPHVKFASHVAFAHLS